MSRFPPLCPTCSRPYIKDEESCVCSNFFHCCRDCKWGEHEGKLVKPCPTHAKLLIHIFGDR
jgi:hypothetical protein